MNLYLVNKLLNDFNCYLPYGNVCAGALHAFTTNRCTFASSLKANEGKKTNRIFFSVVYFFFFLTVKPIQRLREYVKKIRQPRTPSRSCVLSEHLSSTVRELCVNINIVALLCFSNLCFVRLARILRQCV